MLAVGGAAPALDTSQLIEVVESRHKEVKAAFDKNKGDIREVEARLTGIEQELVRRPGSSRQPNASFGHMVTAASEYQSFIDDGKRGTQRIAIPRAALTSAPNSGGALVAPDRRVEPVLLPQRQLLVRDLLAPGETGSNLVQYFRQTVRNLQAAVVSEGTTKPESSFEYELANAPVVTIAHWVPVSRQVMDDAPQLASMLNSDLIYGLKLKEETELLYADGTGERFLGMVPQAAAFNPPFTVTGGNRLDDLLTAIAQSELAMLPATGIIVNTMDWRKMQSLKDDQGRYLGAGPFDLQVSAAWQVPIVPSLSMLQGHFLAALSASPHRFSIAWMSRFSSAPRIATTSSRTC